MHLPETMHVQDTLVELGSLIRPPMAEQSWRKPEDLFSFLDKLLKANWNLVARRGWDDTDRFCRTMDRDIEEIDTDRTFSTRLLIADTGLYVDGFYETESEHTIRMRKKLSQAQPGSAGRPYTIGSISYSVGDEEEALHATVKHYIQKGGVVLGAQRPDLLYGTMSAEAAQSLTEASDPTEAAAEYNLVRVQRVAGFIRTNLYSVN